MAFEPLRLVNVTSAFNAGQIATTFNPNTPTVYENGPRIFTYCSAVDAIATIAAVDYFDTVANQLSVNDWIVATGTDASEWLQVLTITYNPNVVTTVSGFPTGTVGTANITNLAVTAAKIANNTITSTQVALSLLQYAEVNISAAQFNGMYAAPVQLVAAGGANTLIVLNKLVLDMTFVSADYASGGVVAVQYDSTVHGAGVINSGTQTAAAFQAAVSTAFHFPSSWTTVPFSTTVNKGLYLSNLTGAFTTGDSTFKANIWYTIIPTV